MNFQVSIKRKKSEYSLQTFEIFHTGLFSSAFQVITFPCFSVDLKPLSFSEKFCEICLQGSSFLEDVIKQSLKK